jgi:hypothetical protein
MSMGTSSKKREAYSTTTETHDGHDRLIAVTEPLGTGVTTRYGYDVGNRLIKVCAGANADGSTCAQTRTFTHLVGSRVFTGIAKMRTLAYNPNTATTPTPATLARPPVPKPLRPSGSARAVPSRRHKPRQHLAPRLLAALPVLLRKRFHHRSPLTHR